MSGKMRKRDIFEKALFSAYINLGKSMDYIAFESKRHQNRDELE